MKIILHLGAQRTATTTFQHYMRQHAKALSLRGVGFWGPRRTRNGGFFDGLYVGGKLEPSAEHQARAKARVAKALEKSRKRGLTHLVISDENMLGSAKSNLSCAALYPDAKQRLQHFAAALEGGVDTVLVGVRAQDSYWPSAMAYAISRGAMVPNHKKLGAITESRRSWQDVARDISDVFSSAALELHDFDDFAGKPNLRLERATGLTDSPAFMPNLKLNEAPDLSELRRIVAARGPMARSLPEGEGRYQPFTEAALAELKENYADDLFWFAQNSDDRITFIHDTPPEEAGQSLTSALRRGHDHDKARGMDRAS